VPRSTSPDRSHPVGGAWRASRRAFLRGLSGLVAGGAHLLLPSPLDRPLGRWSTWAPRPAAAAGYQTAAPHEASHAFNAVGAVWPDGAPPPGCDLEVRTSVDGDEWSPWQRLRLEGARSRQPRSTLLFVPASRLVQYRLPAPAPLPRLVLIDTVDGPTLADLLPRANPIRLLAAGPGPAAAAAVARPAIVTRAEWGADESWRWWVPEYRVTHHLAVHHTGASSGGADPAAAVRSVYHYHAVVLDWGDVGYHYLVDWTGTLYEGRYGGPNVIGGHIRGHNPGVEGIAALGNYDGAWPSDALEQAVVSLVAWRAETLGIDPQGSSLLDDALVPNLLGHRDAGQTDCPGWHLYLDLGAIRDGVRRRIGYTPRLEATIEAFGAERTVVEAGDRLAITLAIRNRGTIPLQAADGGVAGAARPPRGYVEGADLAPAPRVAAGTLLAGLGADAEIAAARRAAPESAARPSDATDKGAEGPDAPRDNGLPDAAAGYSYRWPLARSVAPGETGALTAYLRLRQPGPRLYGAAVFRQAGDLLAEQAPSLAVRVVAAPAALRGASAVAPRLAFPWLDAPAAATWRRLAVANPDAGPRDLRWMLTAAGGQPAAYAAALGGYGAARWDDVAAAAGEDSAGPWPSQPAPPAAPPTAQQGRDSAAGLLEAAGGVTGAVRLRAPVDRPDGAAPSGALAYAGLTPSDGPLAAPLLGEGWASEIAVQNAGDRATTAEVTWRTPAGPRVVRRQLEPGAAALFTAPPEARSVTIAGAAGSALAALAIATPSSGSPLAYGLPAASGRLLLLPLFGTGEGWTSTLQLLNPAERAAQVSLRWGAYGGSGPWQDSLTLGPGDVVSVPRTQGPALPAGSLGAARIEASAPVVGLAVWRYDASDVYLAAAASTPAADDLVLPLADLPGLPEQRLLAVQSAADGAARVAVYYYDADGAELDRVVDTLAAGGALAYRPRPAAADAAQVVARGAGAPLAAAVLQSPGP